MLRTMEEKDRVLWEHTAQVIYLICLGENIKKVKSWDLQGM